MARQYELNANVLFRWRREYLKEQTVSGDVAGLIPVKLVEAEPSRNATRPADVAPGETLILELHCSTGTVLKLSGPLAQEALREILARILPR